MPRSQSFISDLVLRGKETHHSTPKAATKYTDTSYNRLRGKQENTSGTYRRIHSGTFQEKHSRKNIPEHSWKHIPEHPKKILSGISGRLHLLPESQKKTSETSRRLLPEYPEVCPQDVEETALGTLRRRLTEHSWRTHSGTYRRILSGTFQENIPGKTFRNIPRKYFPKYPRDYIYFQNPRRRLPKHPEDYFRNTREFALRALKRLHTER